MILVLFGQPHCGKTTISDGFEGPFKIDGDHLRSLFSNKDYSREGRIRNLNRASDIAHFLNSTTGRDVILSLVYPYREARTYLRSLTSDVKWVYLTYEGERGREKFHVADFEEPADEEVLHINTSSLTVPQTIEKIENYIHGKISS